MFKKREDGVIVDPATGSPMAIEVNSFNTALGVGAQADIVILRLYHKDWPSHGGLVHPGQVQQFALSAHRAAELAHELLAYAAQVDKESGQQSH